MAKNNEQHTMDEYLLSHLDALYGFDITDGRVSE